MEGESRRLIGGRKAQQTILELAEVRAQAYQFIRDNLNTTSEEVAKRFNVKTQHAYNWIKHCRENRKDARTETLAGGTKTIPGKAEMIQSKGIVELTFDQAAEAIIFAFEQAKSVPSLKEQIYRLENVLAATKNELDNLRKYNQEKEDQAKRFRLAQQQGEILNLRG